AGLLLKTLDRIRAIDLGFRADHLLILRVPRPRGHVSPRYYDEMLERIGALPGVRSASLYTSLTGSAIEGLQIPGRGEKFSVNSITAQPSYFATFQIPIHRGRAFTNQEQHRVVINE